MSQPVAYTYLAKMRESGASDLYLTVGFEPTMRIEDAMQPLSSKLMTPEDVKDILTSILTPRQLRDFEAHMELNTALDMGQMGRFRVNVLRQRQHPALVIRRIITKIPSFDELRLPRILEALSMEKRGLILVTGMTGSGKSTSLAAMINHRNMNAEGHIITIEDPVEYYHEHQKSVITQREVGVDTESFGTAMKNALRQRPDVIMVGEIRDRDVMEQALIASETGHLCLATLHTNNTYQTIERIVNLFPEDHHNQIRLNLSMNLKGIISQRLLPCVKGGQVPALEVMLNMGLIRELIQKGHYEKIIDVMEKNVSMGMGTFDHSLIGLYRDGLISEETAVSYADKPTDIRVKLQEQKLGARGGVFDKIDTSLLKMSE